jgi:hypothetical protein
MEDALEKFIYYSLIFFPYKTVTRGKTIMQYSFLDTHERTHNLSQYIDTHLYHT